MRPAFDNGEIRCVTPARAALGEGPVWDPRCERLFWVDIKGDALFSYDPSTFETALFEAPGMLSTVGLASSGDFICARRNGFALLSIEGESVLFEQIADPEADKTGNRFNDGKVDPAGGFWAGTMDDSEQSVAGAWWRLAPDGGVSSIDDGYRVTNGPAFDPARGRVFLTDSARRMIFVGDSDGVALSNKKEFKTFEDDDGYPDGMTVDREGALWVAFWDASVVRRFDLDGRFVEEIEVAAPRPTSVALVEDHLYVTSAHIGLSEETRASFPSSGGLFKISLSRTLAPDGALFFDDSALPGED